ACGRIIMISEAFAIHEHDLRTRPQDFGEITLTRFVLGATVTAADLMQALRLRRELAEAAESVLQRYDALLCSAALSPAPRFDALPNMSTAASPVQTIPWNVTGHPALSVPTALSPEGLPLGVQLVGRPFDEATLLRIGHTVEAMSGWTAAPLPR
ncbi:MAG TPA: amidase family protein, partial [Acetobacteraceae bacterium]|nr:amidase family protein [Acetobacteraceae bacterium]